MWNMCNVPGDLHTCMRGEIARFFQQCTSNRLCFALSMWLNSLCHSSTLFCAPNGTESNVSIANDVFLSWFCHNNQISTLKLPSPSVLKNRKIRYSLRHWVASWVKVLISWCWPKPTVEMVFRLGSHLVVPISRVASRCWMMSQAWQVENLDDFSNNKIDTASRSFELN